MKVFILILFSLTAALNARAQTGPMSDGSTTILLIRHAEKGLLPADDPLLSDEGQERARNLAQMLEQADLPVDAIFSTPFNRTRMTVGPLADHFEINTQIYDPFNADTLLKSIKDDYQGRVVLIVGHSNTTPELVNRIMEKALLKKIDEEDFSNLFMIRIGEEGKATLSRYTYTVNGKLSRLKPQGRE